MADKKPSAVADARFHKVHNDPRFARLSNKKNKLRIDKRFAAVLQDDKFQSVQGKYDKYGRRIDKKSNELKKFYHLDDDEQAEESESGSDSDEDSAKAKAKVKPASDDDSEAEESDAEMAEGGDEKLSRLDYLNRMARGELESGSDTSDSSDDSDADAYIEEDEEEEKEDIPMGDETKRFAVMNCDWSRIRAVDLFALFQSFAPATGAVKDVTIYPSDFGLEKMKEEEQYGPRGLWSDEKKAQDSIDADGSDEDGSEKAPEDDDDGSDGENDEDDDDPLGVKQTVTAADADGFDVEKLRKYELQKLKYYYAVVTCDSVKTAAAIYENCDQLEYETSSNLLDLRFIPDEMTFANAPKESCQSVSETYKPSIFATMALQNTDVKLTWEEDDDRRVELLTRQAEWKNANDDDFSAYLASENSSSEDDASDGDEDEDDGEKATPKDDRKRAAKMKKIKNRYRKMLLGSDAEDSGDDDGEDASSDEGGDSADEKPAGMASDSDGEGDMEMSFTPGAGDILRAKRQKELEANETPFERYIREKKQEKNKKRHEKRAMQKEQARETKEVLNKKGKAAPEQLKALRAAIDGDEDDDGGDNSEDGGDRNFDMKKIAQSEKVSKLKGKRKAKELKKLQSKKSGLQEGFAFDAADPRFSAIYNKGSQFQLDPTDPKFKKTEATQAIFQERRKRNAHPAATATQKPQADSEGKKGGDLKAMVENLKRKAAAAPPAKSAAKPFKKAKH